MDKREAIYSPISGVLFQTISAVPGQSTVSGATDHQSLQQLQNLGALQHIARRLRE